MSTKIRHGNRDDLTSLSFFAPPKFLKKITPVTSFSKQSLKQLEPLSSNQQILLCLFFFFKTNTYLYLKISRQFNALQMFCYFFYLSKQSQKKPRQLKALNKKRLMKKRQAKFINSLFKTSTKSRNKKSNLNVIEKKRYLLFS